MKTITIVVLVTFLAVGCAGAAKGSRAHEPPPGMKAYEPEHPAVRQPGQKVMIDFIQLVDSESVFAARIDVEQMSAYIKGVQSLAEATLGKSPKPFRVRVQFDCAPEGGQFRIDTQGEPAAELIAAYEEALQHGEQLRVHGGHVRFFVQMSVTP